VVAVFAAAAYCPYFLWLMQFFMVFIFVFDYVLHSTILGLFKRPVLEFRYQEHLPTFKCELTASNFDLNREQPLWRRLTRPFRWPISNCI
jgi:hypothetical protein